MNQFSTIWEKWRSLWLGIGAGACLGCIFRFLVSGRHFAGFYTPITIMTIAFLAVVPLAMGYLAVEQYLRRTPAEKVRWRDWIILPWASILVVMVVSVLVKWEGMICLIFAGPIMLVSSLVGGVLAWLVWRRFGRRSPGSLSAFALPLLLLLVEPYFPAPLDIRTVQTEIFIHAPAANVWSNIKSVSSIRPSELPDSWVERIGFPRPIAATLSHEGVGGVRHASFTEGLVFTETVNRWEPDSDLRFTIHANTDSIPPSTLDEHVTIGGSFFDVLDGEYSLEPRSDGVVLHLTSRERLSTHFNPYAAQWTDAVMKAIQEQILVVIRNRCEAEARAGHL